MTVATIRKKLHEYLDTADDKKIKAMYTLLESEIEEHGYSDEFIALLKKRENYYKNGGTMISAEESKKRINEVLKKAANKH
ncbi:hypothetical protein CAP35_04835 [Chitinophagaceae bacterium IBVUCB1]|nr:hypothetical protein CAP35_04835 [Chitinophagaceae bacterium IBVUCB1]